MSNNILAIIPAYNEEECLESTVEELKRVAPDVDFIVVNDGSTDGTSEIVKAYQTRFQEAGISFNYIYKTNGFA